MSDQQSHYHDATRKRENATKIVAHILESWLGNEYDDMPVPQFLSPVGSESVEFDEGRMIGIVAVRMAVRIVDAMLGISQYELRDRVFRLIYLMDSDEADRTKSFKELCDDCTDRILSLLQADVARREREAFITGSIWGTGCPLDWHGMWPTKHDAEAEALRRYPEGRQQHGKAT